MTPEEKVFEEFNARHCACDDHTDPEIASEIVFSLINGQLYLDIFGLGPWPNVTQSSHRLTKDATARILSYLKDKS